MSRSSHKLNFLSWKFWYLSNWRCCYEVDNVIKPLVDLWRMRRSLWKIFQSPRLTIFLKNFPQEFVTKNFSLQIFNTKFLKYLLSRLHFNVEWLFILNKCLKENLSIHGIYCSLNLSTPRTFFTFQRYYWHILLNYNVIYFAVSLTQRFFMKINHQRFSFFASSTFPTFHKLPFAFIHILINHW